MITYKCMLLWHNYLQEYIILNLTCEYCEMWSCARICVICDWELCCAAVACASGRGGAILISDHNCIMAWHWPHLLSHCAINSISAGRNHARAMRLFSEHVQNRYNNIRPVIYLFRGGWVVYVFGFNFGTPVAGVRCSANEFLFCRMSKNILYDLLIKRNYLYAGITYTVYLDNFVQVLYVAKVIVSFQSMY
jgi:hypothetical protein